MTVNTLYYNKYKRDAKKRNIRFTLTIEQFEEMVFGNCFYCGAGKESKCISGGKKKTMIEAIGIDRINNDKGYTVTNCVGSCKECNFFKKDYTQKQFFAMVKKIYKKHFEKPGTQMEFDFIND